jgi:Predicted ATPase involved in replication control, Cdc46/Mcm family
MADQGLLCLDELDKMSWDDLSSLNEPMEQQTVTETKAGLNVTMSARTPLLAACNPVGGKLNRSDSFEDSLKMIPEATLSRFDLIYFLADMENYDKDVELAKMLLRPKQPDLHSNLNERICKYIAYAKREFSPEMTTGAEDLLSHYFGEIRQAKLSIDDGKPITARDLMALKRLSISLARIRLSNHVDINDALYAIKVFGKSLKTHGSYVNVELGISRLELFKECMST